MLRKNKIKNITESYIEGLADSLGIPEEEIRYDIIKRQIEILNSLLSIRQIIINENKAKEAGMEMGHFLKELGRSHPEFFAPKIVKDFAEKMSKKTGEPLNSVMRSKAVINYWKKVVEK